MYRHATKKINSCDLQTLINMKFIFFERRMNIYYLYLLCCLLKFHDYLREAERFYGYDFCTCWIIIYVDKSLTKILQMKIFFCNVYWAVLPAILKSTASVSNCCLPLWSSKEYRMGIYDEYHYKRT